MTVTLIPSSVEMQAPISALSWWEAKRPKLAACHHLGASDLLIRMLIGGEVRTVKSASAGSEFSERKKRQPDQPTWKESASKHALCIRFQIKIEQCRILESEITKAHLLHSPSKTHIWSSTSQSQPSQIEQNASRRTWGVPMTVLQRETQSKAHRGW